MSERRVRLVNEILDKAKKESLNTATLVLLLAHHTDKCLTKFHKEFMSKEIIPEIIKD